MVVGDIRQFTQSIKAMMVNGWRSVRTFVRKPTANSESQYERIQENVQLEDLS